MAKPKQIRVEFLREDTFGLFPATGVWGGVGPQGDVIAKFFVEERQDPQHVLFDVEGAIPEETGRSGEMDEDGNPIFIRRLQTGVVLRADIARAIGEWLIEKANEAMVQRKSPHTESSH